MTPIRFPDKNSRLTHLSIIAFFTAIVCQFSPRIEAVAQSPTEQSIAAIFDDPAALRTVAEKYDLRQSEFLEQVYRVAGFRPLWAGAHQRQALLRAIAGASADGLRPEDYHHRQIKALLAAAEQSPNKDAELDMLLTEAFARLAYHLRFGKANPRALDANWNFSRALVTDDPARWFYQAITVDGVDKAFAWLKPKHPSYTHLTTELARLRALAAAGDWPKVPDGPTLKPGMTDPRVGVLRRRLSARKRAPAPGEDGDHYFDSLLESAVENYQQRHGLLVDGLVGKRTRAALNIGIAERIDQVRVNLERIRWVFRDISAEFVAVNIAGFHAAYVRNNEIIWQGRAVVGRPYRQTPIFKAAMTHVIFNPTWTVPPTILREDVLPGVRKDPLYLQKKGLKVLTGNGREVDPNSIDWHDLKSAGFPYILRQSPGPKNALGRVKFIFPNPHLVFLHDTPSVELFGRAERTFSSGCIRVERPLELAAAILERQPMTPLEIDEILRTSQAKRIDLARKVPVMLLYLTAFPDPSGTVQFRRDVYLRDPAILKALNGPFRFDPPAGYQTGQTERDCCNANSTL